MSKENSIKKAKSLNNISKKFKRDKKPSKLLTIATVSMVGFVFSIVAYQLSPNYVAQDGMLVEAFGFIPLAYLFGLIIVVSFSLLGSIHLINKSKYK